MRWFIPLFCVALAACNLPGRQDFAPQPVAAAPSTIAALQAFAGRIALVRIQPGTQDFALPLKKAVAQALAIKPDAAFAVRAQAPAGTPDAGVAALGAISPLAESVAQSIIADGVPAQNVALGAQTGGTDLAVFVYVK